LEVVASRIRCSPSWRRSNVKKSFAILGLLSLLAASAAGDDKPGHAGDKEHVVVRPDAVKWARGPASLPPGSEIGVVVGDPSKAGVPYVIRVKLPDGYKVPPHWHPSDENVTVLKGVLLIGTGEKLDAAKTEEVPTGSFMRMPRTMRHFAVAKGETILQLHGVGPFEITYVNPADDPRKKENKK
jgi:quercetin dioxygenase-like cupin family protein